MIFTTRKLFFVICCTLAAYGCWRAYVAFFYTKAPVIELSGISYQQYCAGTIGCTIEISSAAHIQKVTVTLDDKMVLSSERKTQPFNLATNSFSNGPHTITIQAIDRTSNHNSAALTIPFYVDNLPLQAAFAHSESEFHVPQGRTFHLVIGANKPLKKVVCRIFSREFIAVAESAHSPHYECFIPIECEEKPGTHQVTILVDDFIGNHTELVGHLHIDAYTFKRQVLHHIDTEKFAEERKLGRPDKDLRDLLSQIAAQSPQRKLWHGQFYVPLNSNWITCEFGAKRISQERGCYTHAAIDMVGPAPHTVVWAPQDGVVVIKDRFEINGNTVVIDHGCGIITLLCHLDQFADIAVGDKIRRGGPVGVTGKTGYATGDHLHWEMRVQNSNIDPLQWTKADF